MRGSNQNKARVLNEILDDRISTTQLVENCRLKESEVQKYIDSLVREKKIEQCPDNQGYWRVVKTRVSDEKLLSSIPKKGIDAVELAMKLRLSVSEVKHRLDNLGVALFAPPVVSNQKVSNVMTTTLPVARVTELIVNGFKIGDQVSCQKYPKESFVIVELDPSQALIEGGYGFEWVQIGLLRGV